MVTKLLGNQTCGLVAQLDECLPCKLKALGSNPGLATIFSTPVTLIGIVITCTHAFYIQLQGIHSCTTLNEFFMYQIV